ncbi:MAG TPA: hypothetical protein VMN56_05660 [Casimicrobiaceae bacterium]|nr:hypothetical protein [Casimicrobiaceae bacterium]
MWFIPVAIILGIAAIARGRNAPAHVAGALPAGSPPPPLAVLGAHLRQGVPPPPPVILGAIAHAEQIGRFDVAQDIVRTFVEPVVYAHDLAMARNANPIGQEVPMPPTQQQLPPRMQPQPMPMPQQQAPQQQIVPPDLIPIDGVKLNDDAELLRMIRRANGDPRAEQVPVPAAAPEQPAAAGGADPTSMGRSIPIDGVAPAEWSSFIERVEREAPSFSTGRHVGRFRHRRERLLELGFEPKAVMGSAEVQLAALETDMRDAFDHARAGGMIDDYVGTTIAIPARNGQVEHAITLSGMLGVIQAAGLEGAADWLESPHDRKRFPHTTAAFLRTNGVF